MSIIADDLRFTYICMYVLSVLYTVYTVSTVSAVCMVCTDVCSGIHIVCVSYPQCSLPVDMFVRTVSQGYDQFLENHIHCNTYAGVWVTGESEPIP